jgi:hypothetical protein
MWAARYADEGSYGRAFSHFLVAAGLDKERCRTDHGDRFREVTHALAERLGRAGRQDKVNLRIRFVR